jgi:hypothetical protein
MLIFIKISIYRKQICYQIPRPLGHKLFMPQGEGYLPLIMTKDKRVFQITKSKVVITFELDYYLNGHASIYMYE